MIKPHHKKKDFCYKRPAYREAQWERATKVYTINQESKYLLVQGVSAVGASRELIERCALYGDIEEYRLLDEYPTEEFTEVYWIKYKRLCSARFGKKKLDNSSFFGGLLHVCYAPEYETVADTREKINERKRTVLRKCKEYSENEKAKDSHDKLSAVVCTPGNVTDPIHTPTLNSPQTSVDLILTNTSGNVKTTYTNIPSTSLQIDHTLPKVPTKNATLPTELQNLSAAQVYPAYYEDVMKSRKQETVLDVSERQSRSSDSQQTDDINNTSDINDKVRGKRKVINWTKPVSNTRIPSMSENTDSNLAHCYSQEPGAWDPFKEQRKRKVTINEKDELHSTICRIREKLGNSAEPPQKESKDNVDPLQGSSSTQLMVPTVITKKRKDDGRKRI